MSSSSDNFQDAVNKPTWRELLQAAFDRCPESDYPDMKAALDRAKDHCDAPKYRLAVGHAEYAMQSLQEANKIATSAGFVDTAFHTPFASTERELARYIAMLKGRLPDNKSG